MINLWQTKNRWRKICFANTGVGVSTKWKCVYHFKKFLLFSSLDPSLSLSPFLLFFTFGVRKRRPWLRKWPPEYFHTFFCLSRVMAIFCHLFSLTKAADSDDFSSSLNDDGNRFYPICVCERICAEHLKNRNYLTI